MADWHLEHDEEGAAVAVVIDGERRDLSDGEELGSLGDMRDLTVNLSSTLEEMKDSYKGGAIVARFEATHGGYKNNNNYFYVADGMKKSVDTWVKPVPAPYLLNHDRHSDPMGRVKEARFVKTSKTTGYHDLDVRVGDKDEAERIIDGRSLTVSTGSTAIDKTECAVCKHDIYKDGHTPKTYVLDGEMPSREWRRKEAPGIFGMFGMTNEDFWNLRKDEEDETILATCHHIRHAEAPLGGDKFEDTFWYCHGQSYFEVSRVNMPADVNEATGEFAHIREVLEQTDGLDEDLRAKLIIDKLSKIPQGSVDRARFSVVSEDDLWRPATENEAKVLIDKVGDTALFDRGLWIATCAMNEGRAMDELAGAYWAAGGRFIRTTPKALSAKDALSLPVGDFYTWLRASGLPREEKRAMDAAYTAGYLQRRRANI